LFLYVVLSDTVSTTWFCN